MDESRPAKRTPRLIGVINGWPRLFIALAIVILVFGVTWSIGVDRVTGFLVAWDIGVVFFLTAAVLLARSAGSADIRQRAARQDVGETVILTLTAVAATVSIAAIYVELGSRREGAAWVVVFAAGTFMLSWLFVHMFFAFHYAHEFYGRGDGERTGGLAFPGGLSEPDYWDFIYFALVIGMTAQVADVGITDRRIRRTVAAHGLISFFFNVALLGLVVNVGAASIGRG